eukprot:scaffold4659_cov125-Isochrysis_galbana.AAC.7
MPHSAIVRASVLPPAFAYVVPPPCGVFDVELTTFNAVEVAPRDGVFFQYFVFTYSAQLLFAR